MTIRIEEVENPRTSLIVHHLLTFPCLNLNKVFTWVTFFLVFDFFIYLLTSVPCPDEGSGLCYGGDTRGKLCYGANIYLGMFDVWRKRSG